MGGVNRVGHQESGSISGYVRAQRGRARSALFSRVDIINGYKYLTLSFQKVQKLSLKVSRPQASAHLLWQGPRQKPGLSES